MKKRIFAAALTAVICLTGCGEQKDLTLQQDPIPIETAEIAATSDTDSTTAKSTETTASLTLADTASASESKTDTTAAVSFTETSVTEAAAPQHTDSGIENTGSVRASNTLYGKWETVSFSKDSGESVPYDLSDPVHRGYFIGLDLVENGQSVLTAGTAEYPAELSFHGNILTVEAMNGDTPETYEFTVSEDRRSMTVSFINGRIIAELKRAGSVFSIRDYLRAPQEPDIQTIVGEWCYLKTETSIDSVIEVRADGTFAETQVQNNAMSFGTVKAEQNGFAFYDSDGQLYVRFLPDPLNADEFLDDQPEHGRLSSLEKNEFPNDDGFYTPVVMPASSVSPAALAGTWKNADGSGEILEISEVYTTNRRARFVLTEADGSEVRGDVRIMYLVNQGGEKEYCFTFYDDGGKLCFALDVTDTMFITDLYGYQSGEPHFILQQ